MGLRIFMNILYGVQTTGNGHIGRSRDIIKELKDRGHHVEVIFSGEQQSLKSVNSFKPYKIFKGLTYVVENGRINYIKTAPRLDAISYLRDIIYYNAKNIDLIISDFEPVSVQIAKKNKIPSVVISHQTAFLYDIPYPSLHVFIRSIIEHFVPADFKVSTHWHHFGFPILPPILPKSDIKPEGEKGQKQVTVYLPYEDSQEVLSLLRSCPKDYKYHLFTSVNKLKQEDNIIHHPRNRQDFLNTMYCSQGAILHAGFMANTEAFDMGVKTLAKPIIGQAEQIANAMAIETLKFGKQMHHLDKKEVQSFLDLPAIKAMNYPRISSRFVDWIEKGVFNTQTLTDMCEELWNDIPIPSIFRY